MNTTSFFTALICLLLFVACSKRLHKEGNGNIITSVRAVSSFSSMDVEGAFTIYSHTDANARVEVTTDENIASEVRTYVQNGVLYIEMNDDYYNYDFSQMTIHVYGPEYHTAVFDGKVSLFMTDTLHTATLSIEHNGEGVSNLRYNGGTLRYKVNGSAEAQGVGHASTLDVEVNGKSKVDFLNMAAARANVEVNGTGKVYVHCQEHLDATISGSGHIYYLGSPQLVTHISGIGNVSPY